MPSTCSSEIPRRAPAIPNRNVSVLRLYRQTDAIASLVRRLESRFLDGLPETELESLLAIGTKWVFSGEAVVVHQGDRADRLFLMLKGSGRYFIYTHEGKRLLLFWLAPGDIFGASALLQESGQYLCGVEVMRGSEVLVWERGTIQAFAARCQVLLRNALSVACDYLTWYVATHAALTCHTARERLAEVLINLASGIGRRVPGGILVSITNEELANASNVTLFTASRLIAEWHRKGAIVKRRGSVLLRHPERLFHNHTAADPSRSVSQRE